MTFFKVFVFLGLFLALISYSEGRTIESILWFMSIQNLFLYDKVSELVEIKNKAKLGGK